MKPEIQLIQLFLWVCAAYDQHPALKDQRWSPNPTEPLCTAQELVTVSLLGPLPGPFKQKAIHRSVQQHGSDWFPPLPSDQAFNHRLHLLHEVWPLWLGPFGREREMPVATRGVDPFLGSLPIMLAVRGRSCPAQVAREQADQGDWESQKLFYHGGKRHLLGANQDHPLPVPLSLWLTEAARHDWPVLKEQLFVPWSGALVGAKASRDQAPKPALAAQGMSLCTPDKKENGQPVYNVGQSG